LSRCFLNPYSQATSSSIVIGDLRARDIRMLYAGTRAVVKAGGRAREKSADSKVTLLAYRYEITSRG
jgi:hypothetical protein